MTSSVPDDLTEALQAFDRRTAETLATSAKQKSEQIRASFPLEEWPALPVERYALGLADSKSSFCYQLEFGAPELGSIRGGSSRKLIIYARQDGSGWFHDPGFATIEEAWQGVRSGFVQAFELAQRGEVDKVDDIGVLRSGPALTAKALYLYFPGELLPIYSQAHVRQFFERLTGEKAPALPPLAANRRLLELIRADRRFEGWGAIEIMNFLYWWSDPRSAPAIVKIAPGDGARLWRECLDGRFICAGWDDVGDLGAFASEDDFRAAFGAHYPSDGNQSTATRKAKELWRLTYLEPGDRVVANEGQSKVLAVGTVVEPGYVWRPERAEYKHTVSVSWDESYARTLPEPVKRWGVTTVAEVPGTLWRAITGEQPAIAGTTGRTTTPPVVLAAADQQLQSIAQALERKGQVVLFGPPGTGKTYTGLRFAVWWLARSHADLDPLAEFGTPAFGSVVAALSAPPVGPAAWWMVANPAEWSWGRLFAEGWVDFRAGRIAKNYTQIRPGDLVFCYEASPVKQIVGFAQVSEIDAGGAEPVRLRPLSRVADGPTWTQMSQDPLLAGSEPIVNRSQGTLFALSAEEALHLIDLTGEPDPDMSTSIAVRNDVGQFTQVTFHSSYGYEDFIEGFKPVPAPGGGLNLRLVEGVFKRVCRAAAASPDCPYLVFIDEINRGNVPRIFGELITLLEFDKRGLQVRLPQSGQPFTVPRNVYVLGTMNTADRSIRLLDAALRRRFAFHELLPDIEPLEGAYVGKLHLADLLTNLNSRVRTEAGRERQIGQAFLLCDGRPLATEEELGAAIRGDIIPLLQEYAYDDYGMLTRILGPRVVDEGQQCIRQLGDADLAEALYAELQTMPGGEML